jgi:WhiB family redox-sensing transcriptional regulator
MSAKTGAAHGSHNPAIRSDLGWMNSAACHGEEVELFFGPPSEREPERTLREKVAKSICYRCPVMAHCREYALTYPQKGVWGGLNADERIKVRRRQMRRTATVERARKSASTVAADEGVDLAEAAS